MKNKFYILILALLTSSFNAFADGFKLDMSATDVARDMNIPNIASLAIAEKGLVSVYELTMCIDDDILKIASTSKLESSPSEYYPTFEVTRISGNAVSVAFSNKGKAPDLEAAKGAIMEALTSADCDAIKKRHSPLFTVTEFLGAKSMIDLVSNTSRAKISTKKDASPVSSGHQDANEKTDWTVLKSKSPIDDSPTVSLLKDANQSNQTLLLRCQENKTEAIIITNDFLGMDSSAVTIRYDSDNPEKLRFSLSTNNKGLFFPSPISHIKRMVNSKKLTIRYQTYSDGSKTAIFDLTGIQDEIDTLRTACHW